VLGESRFGAHVDEAANKKKRRRRDGGGKKKRGSKMRKQVKEPSRVHIAVFSKYQFGGQRSQRRGEHEERPSTENGKRDGKRTGTPSPED